MCSGYDGIGIGLERVLPNLRGLAYVEVESYVIATIIKKMEEGQMVSAPVYTDVKTFPYREFFGRVDILTGGFPCPPFSNAGKRKGTEDPRHLYPHISRGINECRPSFVFLENVEGIISTKTPDGESVLHYVCRDLQQMGYETTSGVFSAEEVGFSHQRKRVFILGYNKHARSEFRRWQESQELVDSSSDGRKPRQSSSNSGTTCGRPSGEEREVSRGLSESSGGCDKLSDSEDIGRRGRKDNNNDTERKFQESAEGEQSDLWSEVERRCRDALQLSDTDCVRAQIQAEGELAAEQVFGSARSQWVSRINEPQQEWEEPRAVEAQPELGGTTYGDTCRHDRLRMLGNGCCPDTVSRAFIILSNRLEV